MHAPRPYGLFVDGGELTERDKTFISHQMRKLTNTIQTEEVTNYRHEYELPDGGYVIVQDMGGIFKAIARKKEKFEKFKPDGFARLYVPMLFSGVITNARPRKPDQEEYGQGAGFKITEQCRNRLRNYNPKIERPAKQLELQRFIIKPNQITVPEFVPKDDYSNFTITQYVQQRPTWYSGAMVEVMQIVGGYGRQDFNALPNNDIERARFLIPDKYIVDIAEKLKGYRLPAYTGVPPIDGKYQYDYKFSGTNGVSFDSSGKPWLLRIRPTGIYAMPLPIVPATTTPEFRQYVEEVGDDELLKILDRFGGMPSGEGMPAAKDFEAWRRAGVIIKVCDTADFYTKSSYSDTCGWSFNSRGTEGFNTCYTSDDQGIKQGLAYKLSLALVPATKHGWLRTTWQFESAADSSAVNNYLLALFKLMNVSEQSELAIRYKIGRQNTEQILGRAKAKPVMDRKEILYWDNLELDPIANHNGSVRQVGKGALYHNAKPAFQPQIKFPNVFMGGCVSFDFGSDLPIAADKRPNCDTIMYGYYVGDSLKVVKYFVDWRSYNRQVESNFEPVMTVGSWEKIETTGGTSPQGYFYTSDLDFREIFSPKVITTTIKGEDKGFDSKPWFAYAVPFAMRGTLWRNRYYTHKTLSTTTTHEAIALGLCIPYLCRDAVIVAKKNTIAGDSRTDSLSLEAMRDPTSYQYWTYDFVFAWREPLSKQTGKPYPKDGSPVWVEIEDYNPSPYSDFADQGAWIPGLPYDITSIVHPNKNEWIQEGGGGSPKVNIYSTTTINGTKITGGLHLSIVDNPYQVNALVPVEWYFYVSPDEYGSVFYRDSCRVGFGESEYANISELGNNNLRKSWGYTQLADHKSAHHFIGVINE